MAVPSASAAAPEALLPASTQIYVRWDGGKALPADFAKTAVGKLHATETGKMREALLASVLKLLPPDVQAQSAWTKYQPVLETVYNSGFIVAVDVQQISPPVVTVSLIAPNAPAKPFQELVDYMAQEAHAKVEVRTIGTQAVRVIEAGPVRLVGRATDGHAVLQVTTRSVAELLEAKDDTLLTSPQYKELTAFKEFPTHTRFFLDLPAVLKVVKTLPMKEIQAVLDVIGLDGVQSVRYWGGYDGLAQRDRLDVVTNGPRKGLLGLWNATPFTLKDLPALPPSLTGFTVGTLDGAKLYDTIWDAANLLTQTFEPQALPQLKQGLQEAERELGFNLHDDLLATFKGIYAAYAAENEGIFGLGGTIAVQVKDEKKLQATLEKLAALAKKASRQDVSITQKQYRSATLYELRVKAEGMIFAPTYTFHKGYFVVSLYPQAVTGYIARADGALPAWKPEPALQASLDKLPGKFVGLQMNDPRPSVQTLFTLLPLGTAAARGFVPGFDFDVSTIPNVQAVNQHLFPNIIVTTDDGKTIRDDRLTSMDLPPLDSPTGLFMAFGMLSTLGQRANSTFQNVSETIGPGTPAPTAKKPIEVPIPRKPEEKKELPKREDKKDTRPENKQPIPKDAPKKDAPKPQERKAD
jgi:hypothetical protein